MEITYERDVNHCDPTTYAKNVTIKTVAHAENSDNLDAVTFNELGWNAVVKRDQFVVGDIVFFIPAESVLPHELSELVGVTNYLSKGKVRVTRLRGNRSEGLVVDYDLVKDYIPFIMKWEDLPSHAMRGDAVPRAEINPKFEKFYKVQNILNEPYTFNVGEQVAYSEKVHGTSVKFSILPKPGTDGLYELYVGSNNTVLKEGDNLYWNTVKKVLDCLPCLPKGIPFNYIFYGEIYGSKIQDLNYGEIYPRLIIFAIKNTATDQYLGVDEFNDICDFYELKRVNKYKIVFESIEQLRELADLPSEMTDKHIREGIVIVSDENPNKMAKCISFKYLTRGGKKTERG